jgi:hypothetical protein
MALHTSSLLSTVISGLLRALGWTWRLRVHDLVGLTNGRGATLPPVIWVLWHNRILVVPVLYERLFRRRKGAVLISRSRDGGILAGVIERFGGEPVRGSSSRGGSGAMRELQRRLADGCDVYITPDGPKGPRYSMGPGAPWLAQVSGAALLPLSVECSSYWRLGRWDGFLIPKPFARIDVTLRELHEVPPTADDTMLDGERERLQALMMEQTGVR